jgi:hypothetical protein
MSGELCIWPFVKSQVCYASEVWSPHQSNLKIKSEQMQRRATRWMLKVKVGEVPYRDRLYILNMLPLCYDREIRDLMFFYKAGFYDLNVEEFSLLSLMGEHVSVVIPPLF